MSEKSVTMRQAVFLDRDGTINKEKEYLYRVADFEFIPGAEEAIKSLKDAGFLVIVVTNQSGVARGYYSGNDVDVLHQYVQKELARYATGIDAFYVCPHHPTEGQGELLQNCECRKGAPGMLLQAATDYHIDLAQSYIVGDKLADVEAGERAGCTPILVLTGHGSVESEQLADGRVKVCGDLRDAARVILNQT